ncbi:MULTISPECIES: polyprenyl diphosphate synthase [Pseudodesulfovibrio]|uniref:Isoprenyl transferase n=1 Tax=Pseudodesulfovibrio aespoeensis (strain ATCC 700646 / DSM 10631 / Aspo-2) TaxID=643562 RepID=E6VSU6_PSEA9|nr:MULTISPECIES: polyprenyl diphosphate synthase [Pseudodesulfovibrio]ADU63190.1 undecaprenyl diphosphate synthase [Pseudodesulfovibrio aespoeensis Aspo-2]
MQSITAPTHVAIIMDGNGRWAKQRGLPRTEGHKAGTEAARAVVTRCRELGVKHLTLYTFSKENWARPKDEVRTLFDLLTTFLTREESSLKKQSIRLRVLGEIDDMPMAVRQTLKHVMRQTAKCEAMTLNLALNYSGRDEILRAARALVAKGTAPDAITEEAFAAELWTAGQPDPDLIIRTSGEMRLSNYLLFQCAYSEFYFTDIYWPDFTPDELDKALVELAGRRRRFGMTDEQLA